MSERVTVFQLRDHTRSKVICEALAAGIRAAGDVPVIRDPDTYAGADTRVCAFYGLESQLPRIFQDYKSTPGARAVYVDLGYWGRRQGGRWTGFHKLVVNARHPTAYFQRERHPGDRAAALGVAPAPWRSDGDAILLAGMGDKGAGAEGFLPEAWERETIAQLRRYTKRRIIYRPKPSWKKAKPIEGVGFSPRTEDVERVLARAWAVVTHHSNVAVDGLVAGVPAFSYGGVAEPLALRDLSRIEDPLRPDGREQWIADLAYTQWSVAEIASGAPWRHLRREGLL